MNSLSWHNPVYQAQENPQEILRPLRNMKKNVNILYGLQNVSM